MTRQEHVCSVRHTDANSEKMVKGGNNGSSPILACKDENGTLKTDKQEIMNRWKQYFADLMKTDKQIENQIQAAQIIENETEIESPTYK